MPLKFVFFVLATSLVFPLNAQLAEIPFELDDNGMITVQVKINDHPQAKTFVLDTGATADLLDTATAEELGLEADHQQEVAGAGGVKSYDIILSQQLTLDTNITVNDTHLVLADLSQLRSRKPEKKMEGILGYSLLKKYITKIDYENQKILFYDKIDTVDTLGFQKIPFEFGQGIPIPQFDIEIVLNNGVSYTDKVFLDSGAGLTLLINSPFNEKFQLAKQAGNSLVNDSENLHGTSTSESIALKSVILGDYQLNDLVISIAHDQAGVSSFENYMGILGSKIISRFNVILDYTTSHVYLKPNNTFSRPFEFPLCGISLQQEQDKIVIAKIAKSSDAYRLGVRKGDLLIAIDDDYSGELTTYKNLLKREGETVRLQIMDTEGVIKEIEIPLKRML
ncbi:MAG: aspartyl protease family protein [Flavobacteriaceae bacterium]